MLDVVLDVIGLLDRPDTLYAAYKAAWKKRARSGDTAAAILRDELKSRSVPGAYDDQNSPRVFPAFEAWADGVEPRRAKAALKRAPVKL